MSRSDDRWRAPAAFTVLALFVMGCHHTENIDRRGGGRTAQTSGSVVVAALMPAPTASPTLSWYPVPHLGNAVVDKLYVRSYEELSEGRTDDAIRTLEEARSIAVRKRLQGRAVADIDFTLKQARVIAARQTGVALAPSTAWLSSHGDELRAASAAVPPATKAGFPVAASPPLRNF